MNATTSIRRTICAAMCIAAASLVAQPATNLSARRSKRDSGVGCELCAGARRMPRRGVCGVVRAGDGLLRERLPRPYRPEGAAYRAREERAALPRSRPVGPRRRARAARAPTVELEVAPNGVRGVANLGMAEYQDEYTKTRDGWRFASRTVIVAAEKAAGLDARELLAIGKLGGSELGDYYETDQNGVRRLLTSGVRVAVADAEVTGRAYLRAGGYNDQVYEKVAPGVWRVKSSVYVPAEAR